MESRGHEGQNAGDHLEWLRAKILSLFAAGTIGGRQMSPIHLAGAPGASGVIISVFACEQLANLLASGRVHGPRSDKSRKREGVKGEEVL